jgi:hypothetical protein
MEVQVESSAVNNNNAGTATSISDEELLQVYTSEGYKEEDIKRLLELNKQMYDQKQADEELKKQIESGEAEATDENWYITDTGDNHKYGSISAMDSGILGMPFAFNNDADPTWEGTSAGRLYARKIIADVPLVVFQLGKPRFMDGSSFLTGANKDSKSTMQKIMGIADEGERESAMGALAATGKVNDTRYYSFKDDFITYTDYVNTMCRFTAIKMGLGSKKAPGGQSYFNFDVRELRNDNIFQTAVGQSNYVAVYANGGTSHSESGSNSTSESMLGSVTKKAGQMKREVDFLFGGGTGNKLDEMSVSNYNETVKGLTTDLGDPTGLIDRLVSGAQTIMAGGNLLFPEIWSDSSYRKSYTIDMKFHSPYGDPESVFLNVYVPFFHIFCMAMPRQNSKQGFSGPFVLKAYSKGWFNCDLGMVESIEVRKGGNDGQSWTAGGLPTSLDVSVTIKDLYPTLMMTQAKGASGILFNNNTGLIEHLNLMAGIELHGIHMLQNFITGAAMALGQVTEIPSKIEDVIGQGIYNTIKNISVKAFGGTE